MRSYWHPIWLLSFKEKKRLSIETLEWQYHVMAQAEQEVCSCKARNFKNCRQTTWSQRRQGEILPCRFQREPESATSWFLTSSPQNCETTTFCCFKSPGLRYFSHRSPKNVGQPIPNAIIEIHYTFNMHKLPWLSKYFCIYCPEAVGASEQLWEQCGPILQKEKQRIKEGIKKLLFLCSYSKELVFLLDTDIIFSTWVSGKLDVWPSLADVSYYMKRMAVCQSSS